MYTAALFILLAGRASLVTAHGYVKSWTVNGESNLDFRLPMLKKSKVE